MSRKKTIEEFIEQAKAVHGSKYNYSKVKYINNSTNVCIICHKHGEFWQSPANHLKGHNCPKCVGNGAYKLTQDNFIERAKQKHDNKYDYSKVEYKNYETKVCIICPEHGEFWQTPNCHLNGQGCPKCANNKRRQKLFYNKDIFINKAKKIHGDAYDYSKVNYVDSKTPICIICSEHGEFWQRPDKHLTGKGCPICGRNTISQKLKLTKKDFINKAEHIHKDKYCYDEVFFNGCNDKVNIICPIHGVFKQMVSSHLQGHGCPKCGNVISKAEGEIIDCLKPLKIEHQNKMILNNKEIDIFIPSLNIGIEYNGLRWHSEEFGKDKNYHLNKLKECNDKHISLIHIFEDEWKNHKEICVSNLRNICGINVHQKIDGRKCVIKQIINKDTANQFLSRNHIQGKTKFTVALGAYFGGTLVSVMTFVKEKEDVWRINRFADNINYHCIDTVDKLFKHFISHFSFRKIKLFADRRWTISPYSNAYIKLGFKFECFVNPTYTYYNWKFGTKRFQKFNFNKQNLHKKYGLPLSLSENEMAKALGYTRIWDCGRILYVYKENNGF